MDLRRVGLSTHANAAMNRYWDGADESDSALVLLPFFMALRSAVRMSVAVESGKLDEAQTYRSLGHDLMKGAKPVLVAVGGLSGSGKSAVAKAIASRLPGPAGARVLRTDVLRKLQTSLRLGEKAPEQMYEPQERAKVYEQLTRRATDAVRAHASVVADATFSEGVARDEIAKAANGASFHAFWLAAPLSVRLARVSSRVGDVSDADVNVAARQTEPHDLSRTWNVVDADRPVEAIAAEILDAIAAYKAGPNA
jgi:predicted kinase